MDRDSSLLPKSLFSASSLKREPADQAIDAFGESMNDNHKNNNATMTHASSPAPASPTPDQKQQESPRRYRKGKEKATTDFEYFDNAIRNSVTFPPQAPTESSDSEQQHESDYYSSSNSSVSSEAEEIDNVDTFEKDHLSASELIKIMQRLQKKLEKQHVRHTRYQHKLKLLQKSINNTNTLLIYHANLLANINGSTNTTRQKEVASVISSKSTKPPASVPTNTYAIPQVAKRSQPFPEDIINSQRSPKQRRIAEVDALNTSIDVVETGVLRNATDSDSRRMDHLRPTESARSVSDSNVTRPSSRPRSPAQTECVQSTRSASANNFKESAPGKKTRHEPDQFRRFAAFGKSTARPVVKEIPYATKDFMEVFTVNRIAAQAVFSRKPRSILTSISPDSMGSHMRDLMVTTDLNGDLQFWNTQTRRTIKTIGKQYLFDSWVEDICWITTTSLALCPNKKDEAEAVKIIHLNKVNSTEATGKIQCLKENPHDERGVATMSSAVTGDYNTPGVEKSSFVTAGHDKTVYIWNMSRESPHEEFTVANVSFLPMGHTNTVQALCYNKYKSYLYTGGADNRFKIYDLQANSISRELKLDARVTQIKPSPVNPNITMITTAAVSDQFTIFDQRMDGYSGLVLNFGQRETENLSRYVKPDIHQNGYMVCCGSQSSARLNFFDLRSRSVSRGPSFSLGTGMKSTKVLWSCFLPKANTVVSTSSTEFEHIFVLIVKDMDWVEVVAPLQKSYGERRCRSKRSAPANIPIYFDDTALAHCDSISYF